MPMARLLLRILLFSLFILAPIGLAVVFTYKASPPELSFHETSFDALPGWDEAGHAGAFSAFLKSCDKLTPRPGFLIPDRFKTEAYDRAFKDACAKAKEGADFFGANDQNAKGFFESAFQPHAMKVGWERTGKITGYFEPLLEASFEQSDDYPWPLYAAPNDQIRVNLAEFRSDLTGTIVGRIEGRRFLPYFTRQDIDEGAFDGRGMEILYAKDIVDVYFLQVQGSGRAQLPDGSIIGVGYAGKNGHANTLAGRTLVQAGHMEVAEVSMQSIRQWFVDNPDRVFEILHEDESYVFFHITGGDGPFGSSTAVLTPEHSLAVDPKFIPMGLPVFIDGDIPLLSDPENATEPLNQILIAQDTGGAIKGAIRGDVFWGQGEKALVMAGYMNNEAEFTLLLPVGALGDDQ